MHISKLVLCNISWSSSHCLLHLLCQSPFAHKGLLLDLFAYKRLAIATTAQFLLPVLILLLSGHWEDRLNADCILTGETQNLHHDGGER